MVQGGSSSVNGVDDAACFRVVRDAMRVMEVSVDEQEALIKLVAVVIHLGNVEYASGDATGPARILNPELVATIAQVIKRST